MYALILLYYPYNGCHKSNFRDSFARKIPVLNGLWLPPLEATLCS